jgi:hypothetical protein
MMGDEVGRKPVGLAGSPRRVPRAIDDPSIASLEVLRALLEALPASLDALQGLFEAL